MAEEKVKSTGPSDKAKAAAEPVAVEAKPALAAAAPDKPKPLARGKNLRPKRRGLRGDSGQEEFEQKIIDIARVTRVMAGGKRMRFRACVALGNRKGRVAIGIAKGADVTIAVTKAVNSAKKRMIEVPIVNDTIPHALYQKYGAARILFKPAGQGRGIIAGGAVRIVLELSGIKNISSKIIGTNNKVNNAKCTMAALMSLKGVEAKKNKQDDGKNLEKEKQNKK